MRPAMIVAGVLLAAGRAGAVPGPEEDARAVVARAVAAHGGEDRLAGDHAERVRFRGTIYGDKTSSPFEAETLVQLPGQLKTRIEMRLGDGRKQALVQLVDGTKAALFLNGRPEKMDLAARQEMAAKLQVQRVLRLVPLLRDRSYELAPLPDVKVNDRPAAGVRVSARGRGELRLYFDRELGLLVKSEHGLDDGAGRVVRQEEYYGEFRDVEGRKRPFKVAAYRDGRKVMEAEVVDFKDLGRIDDAEFSRP
jgi:hypothetical protein